MMDGHETKYIYICIWWACSWTYICMPLGAVVLSKDKTFYWESVRACKSWDAKKKKRKRNVYIMDERYIAKAILFF